MMRWFEHIEKSMIIQYNVIITIGKRWKMKTLYVIDLDGTLLNDEGKLSNNSRRILVELLEQDVLLTIASARSIQSIQKILSGLDLKLPVISFNGAYLSNFKTGMHYEVNDIDDSLIFDVLKEYGVLISTHSQKGDTLYQAGPLSEGARAYVEDRKKNLHSKVSMIEVLPSNEKIMAYTVIDSDNQIQCVEKALKKFDNIVVDAWEDMYYKPWYWLSVHSAVATKANGIKALCSLIGHQGDVVVFGDNTNDIEMFKFADRSIAVGNAVITLKVYADEVIDTNTSDSVVKKILAMEAT